MKVITLGTFDVLHYCHFSLLRFGKELAGRDDFIIGLNSDEFVEKFKGKRPVMNYSERKETLLSLPWVDRVVKNYQPKADAGKTILLTGARIVVSGFDWYTKDLPKQWGVTSEWLENSGICVCYFPSSKFYRNSDPITSSMIKERIIKQNDLVNHTLS